MLHKNFCKALFSFLFCTTFLFCWFKKAFFLKNYLFLTELGLHCGAQAFSSCSNQGLQLVVVSRCGGFSCCGGWTVLGLIARWRSVPLYGILEGRTFSIRSSGPRKKHCPVTCDLVNISLTPSLCLLLLHQFSSVAQLLSSVLLFVTPWTAARQASLSITKHYSIPLSNSRCCFYCVVKNNFNIIHLSQFRHLNCLWYSVIMSWKQCIYAQAEMVQVCILW